MCSRSTWVSFTKKGIYIVDVCVFLFLWFQFCLRIFKFIAEISHRIHLSVMGVSALPVAGTSTHGLDKVSKISKELNWISIFNLKSFHYSLQYRYCVFKGTGYIGDNISLQKQLSDRYTMLVCGFSSSHWESVRDTATSTDSHPGTITGYWKRFAVIQWWQ